MDNYYLMYVNGEFRDTSSGEKITVLNPATEEVVGSCVKATKEEAEEAIQHARIAFDNGSWSGLKASQRASYLYQIADKLEERIDALTKLHVQESGSTIIKAKGEIHSSVRTIRHFAKLCQTDYHYEAITPNEEAISFSYNFIEREPIGVCAGIVPWNFPFSLAIWKIAPALATGNTIIVKPASETPLTMLELAKIVDEVGLPKGVLNIIPGSGAVIGETLAEHPQIDKIAFTGSTVVGKRVMELASTNVKIVTLELGGKSANIILDDANLEVAIDGALFGTFYHSGQVCESGTRLLVQESIYDEVINKLVERAKMIKVGDPFQPQSGMGPVISRKQRDQIEEYIRIGKEEGARLVLGGERPTGSIFEKGFWIMPTIFADVKNDMRIAQEEIFGPVLSVIKFKTDDEAVQIANDTIYGLAGGVWSKNNKRAVSVAKRMRTGTVWINAYHLLADTAPFGGYKQSGIGRELGIQGLLAYTQTKHIHVDLDQSTSRYKILLPEKE
ncbi:aldehyde dehydrogenase family protein [Ornithinibacillus bavariensis]|uniref:aldehyde dehydrogenase family protein n=1 Tax=Ornithinibacillus bavariensis TaxID=545502 RepID=UPI003D1BA65D